MTGFSEISPEPDPEKRIPTRIKVVLTAWGAAVLLLAALLMFWIHHTQRAQDRAVDRAMCSMMDVIIAGPEPVAGPAGDRARAVRHAMQEYQRSLGCDKFRD